MTDMGTINAVLLTEEQAKECSKHPLATAVAARFPALLRAMLVMLVMLLLFVVLAVWHLTFQAYEQHRLTDLAIHKGAVWLMFILSLTAIVLAWELHWMRKFALSPDVLAAACGLSRPAQECDPILLRREQDQVDHEEEVELYRHLHQACEALSEHAVKHAELGQHAATRAEIEQHLAVELMARAACELLEMSKNVLTPHGRAETCPPLELDSD